jgi:hypothetical protein
LDRYFLAGWLFEWSAKLTNLNVVRWIRHRALQVPFDVQRDDGARNI